MAVPGEFTIRRAGGGGGMDPVKAASVMAKMFAPRPFVIMPPIPAPPVPKGPDPLAPGLVVIIPGNVIPNFPQVNVGMPNRGTSFGVSRSQPGFSVGILPQQQGPPMMGTIPILGRSDTTLPGTGAATGKTDPGMDLIGTIPILGSMSTSGTQQVIFAKFGELWDPLFDKDCDELEKLVPEILARMSSKFLEKRTDAAQELAMILHKCPQFGEGDFIRRKEREVVIEWGHYTHTLNEVLKYWWPCLEARLAFKRLSALTIDKTNYVERGVFQVLTDDASQQFLNDLTLLNEIMSHADERLRQCIGVSVEDLAAAVQEQGVLFRNPIQPTYMEGNSYEFWGMFKALKLDTPWTVRGTD